MTDSSANAPYGSTDVPMTRSPTDIPETPGPVSRTSPHSSTPGVNGRSGLTW